MDSIAFYLLFPSLFMIHEMEEILLMPKFMSSMIDNTKFKNLKELYTPYRFNLIVFEEFLILLCLLAYSFYLGNFTIYQTIIIAYNYHIIIHIIQTLYLRKYVPGLLSGIVTGVYCSLLIHQLLQINLQLYISSILTLIIIMLNLIFCFKVLNFFSER